MVEKNHFWSRCTPKFNFFFKKIKLLFFKVITHPNLVPQDEIQKIDKNGTL
jgi:hypothetical protein